MNERKSGPAKGKPPAEGAGRRQRRQPSASLELRSLYRDMLDEPVPDDMLRLLDELEKKDAGGEGSGNQGD